MESKF
jgi:hypothetical protein